MGDFGVTVDGRLVTASDFERRSGAELIQLLALAPNRRLHREKVIDALWPDAPLASATNQFHKAASYARSGLGDRKAIVIRDELVHLFPHAGEVTSDVESILAARADDDRSLTDAVGAYRGGLLPDVPYADWAIEQREAVKQALIQVLGEAGRWSDVVALDPLDERANVEVMRQDLARGDRTAVVRRFDELGRRLASELGLEPGPDAVDVRNQAAHQALLEPTELDPAGPDPAGPDPTGPHPAGLGPGAAGPDAGDDGGAGIEDTASHRTVDRAVSRLPRTIGRVDELDRVLAALDSARFVSLIGPGGIGKTHLATVTAERVARSSQAPDGAVVCHFGRVDSEAGVLQETLTALGTRRQTDTTVIESIVRAVETRSVLLVFDNCEHVVDAVRELARTLLARAPGIRVLATTRVAIGLDAEQQFPLEAMTRADAIELFVAEAARHGASVDAVDPLVDRLCARVDDLPLAVRLVAARTRTFDLATVDGAMGDGLGLIGDDVMPGGDYARTLRETVEWSIDSLDPELQDTLVDLAVFADRFDLDAARAVLDPGLSQIELLQRIDELVGRSLLAVGRGAQDAGSGGRSVFRLLEGIRHVTRERGVPPEVRLRHLEHCRREVETADALLSTDSGRGLARYRELWNDLRTAVATAAELDRLGDARGIVAACATYANLVLQFEVIDWCEQILSPDDVVVEEGHAAALATWSTLINHRNEVDAATALTIKAAEHFGDQPLVAYARAWIPWGQGKVDEADAILRDLLDNPDAPVASLAGALTLRSVLLWTTGQDVGQCAHRLQVMAAGRGPLFAAQALVARGIHLTWTDHDDAVAALDQSIAICDRHRLVTLGASARAVKGVAVGVSAPIDEALRVIRANLEWAIGHGFWSFVMAAGLGTASMIFDRAARPDLAVPMISATHAHGYVTGFNDDFINDVVGRARDAHPDRFEQWWNTGQDLDTVATGAFGLAAIDELLTIA